jgi:hypothetical protein
MDPKLEQKRVEILQSLLDLLETNVSKTESKMQIYSDLNDIFSPHHKMRDLKRILEMSKKVSERLKLRYERVLVCNDINRLKHKDNSLAGGYLSF